MTASAFDTFFPKFTDSIQGTELSAFQSELAETLERQFFSKKHGRKDEWDAALAALPDQQAIEFNLDNDLIQVGTESELDISTKEFETQLKSFMPWRKGPFDLFGTNINTEWRSDWKWQRISPHISPLKNRASLGYRLR